MVNSINRVKYVKEAIKMSIAGKILEVFKGKRFSLKDAYTANPSVPEASVRRSIYENLGKDFERVGKGLYMVINDDGTYNEQILVMEGNGRNLSGIKDSSLDAIITDHPWSDPKSNKGGNRAFATYDTFEYQQEDFDGDLMHYADNQTDPSISQAYAS